MTLTTTQKYAIGIGALLLTAIVGYWFWRSQWKPFVNIGDSRWLPTRYNDARLGLQMPSASHGLKVGDSIVIDHDNPETPKGNAQVLDVVVKAGTTFIITNLKAPASNPDHAGRIKRA